MGDRTKDIPQLDPSSLIDISTLSELCRKYTGFNYLLREWHPTRNRNLLPYGITLTPDSVAISDSRPVWWQCSKGHNWSATVGDRLDGSLGNASRRRGNRKGNADLSACPFCKTEQVVRAKTLWDYCSSEAPDGEIDCSYILDEWDYDKNAPLTPKDVRTLAYRKVWWQCARGHSWQALISNRVKAGVGCPYCGHRKVLSGFNDLQTLFPSIAEEWDQLRNASDPNVPDAPTEVTAFSNRKVWWLCPNKHSYMKTISNRTQLSQGCPLCRAIKNEKGSMLLSGVNDLATTHPEIAAEWSYVRNGSLMPSDVKAGSRRLVWWRCGRGHEWQTPVARRTGKRRIGCPECRRSIGDKRFDDADEE